MLPLLDRHGSSNLEKQNVDVQGTNREIIWDVAIAQWIRLQLPFCRPVFESQAHHLRFKFGLYLSCEKNENKHFFKKQREFSPLWGTPSNGESGWRSITVHMDGAYAINKF